MALESGTVHVGTWLERNYLFLLEHLPAPRLCCDCVWSTNGESGPVCSYVPQPSLSDQPAHRATSLMAERPLRLPRLPPWPPAPPPPPPSAPPFSFFDFPSETCPQCQIKLLRWIQALRSSSQPDPLRGFLIIQSHHTLSLACVRGSS